MSPDGLGSLLGELVVPQHKPQFFQLLPQAFGALHELYNASVSQFGVPEDEFVAGKVGQFSHEIPQQVHSLVADSVAREVDAQLSELLQAAQCLWNVLQPQVCDPIRLQVKLQLAKLFEFR